MAQILRDQFFHEFSSVNGAPRLHTLSISSEADAQTIFSGPNGVSSALKVRSRPTLISRRSHAAAQLTQQSLNLHYQHNIDGVYASEDWETVVVPGPDLTDKATVVNLAKMCSDAYISTPSQPDWLNTTVGFNHSHSFGWKGDGLRGHVFSDKTNETVIVAFKGTTVGKV